MIEIIIVGVLFLCVIVFALDSLGVLAWQVSLILLGLVFVASVIWLTLEAMQAKEDEEIMSIFWLFIAALVSWVTPDPERNRNHYDGDCQSDGTMKEYDQMTTQEHDEVGAFFGTIARGDDE